MKKMDNVVIYGKNAVLEALRAKREVKELLITEDVLKKEGEIRNLIRILNVNYKVIDSKKFKNVINQKFQLSGQFQGIVAEVAEYEYLDFSELLANIERKDDPAFVIMLDGLEDVHNLGAIIRSAEAVGVDAIIIPKHGSVSLNATVARLSAGAVEYVPVVQVANLNRAVERLKKAGIWLVGTDASEAVDYRAVDMRIPVCIVVGSEGRGMSRLVKEACDFKVFLPMVGKITSLNASVASALLAYEVFSQRNPVK